LAIEIGKYAYYVKDILTNLDLHIFQMYSLQSYILDIPLPAT